MEGGKGEFRTANLALAALLDLNHLKPLRSEWEDGTCFWIFSESSQLSELVTQFSGGTATVDPRAYSYKLTQMRKEMRSN